MQIRQCLSVSTADCLLCHGRAEDPLVQSIEHCGLQGVGICVEREGLTKDRVQKVDFIPPVLVRAVLALGKEEALARVKASADQRSCSLRLYWFTQPNSDSEDEDVPPDSVESAVFTRNLDDPMQAEQVESGTARLEDDQVGRDEEGRLASSSAFPRSAVTYTDPHPCLLHAVHPRSSAYTRKTHLNK